MTTVNIYLTFNGNCLEAFSFYKTVFGGDFLSISRYKDMPEDCDPKYSPEEADRIMHVSLPVSKETILMGSDAGGEWASKYTPGNNFSISINTDSREKADQFFSALSQDGNPIMPMDQTFWGSYFGMLIDKYGISWMVSFNEEPMA